MYKASAAALVDKAEETPQQTYGPATQIKREKPCFERPANDQHSRLGATEWGI